MKKQILVLTLLFSILLYSSPASLLEKPEMNKSQAAFILPSALVTIESGAFENTAAEIVVISNSLTTIGEGAFANSRVLKTVYIPESVVCIGEHAFEGITNLNISGAKNSYAARWAQEHNISFVPTESAPVWVEKIRKLLHLFIYLSPVFGFCPKLVFQQKRKTDTFVRSMRPQDRDELYIIDYKFP